MSVARSARVPVSGDRNRRVDGDLTPILLPGPPNTRAARPQRARRSRAAKRLRAYLTCFAAGLLLGSGVTRALQPRRVEARAVVKPAPEEKPVVRVRTILREAAQR